ncbi:uncharacterized protein [Enoplosus armatus]|uniref:uncharacterized protein n=1 Tax=Enoplosus armatus TaxID=215367 RepID=UPI00399485CB
MLFERTRRELVRDLQCYITSSKHSRCSWLPASHVPDFGFFYRLSNEDGSKSIHDNSLPLLRECPRYIDTGGVRTGCDLQANFTQAIHVLFNGTLNNTLVRNTFKKWVKDDVRPPPLNWTVTKTGEKFIITWIPPDFVDLSHWTFVIDYTECKTPKVKTVEDETSLHLDLVPHCQYCMAIRAKETRGKGETRESNTTCFDADTDPNALVYVAVIIPLMFAGLAALAFVCCRKNKENIFPKVPEPRDLLSDISNNNNKITVRNLYVPAEEEDSCKITLVMDSEINQICNH